MIGWPVLRLQVFLGIVSKESEEKEGLDEYWTFVKGGKLFSR